MDVRVILINPQEEGNIGSVARAMKNFGYSELYLVSPPTLGGPAYAFASHGSDVLDSAAIVDDVSEALVDCDFIVGTTGKKGGHKTPKRKAVLPEQLKEALEGATSGKVALLFGNEAYGIPNEVLEKTDFVVRIPTSPKYPILNLAQSVCVILYELSKRSFEKTVVERPPSRQLRKNLDNYTEEIVGKVYEQPHHKRSAVASLSRIYGKAMLSEQEAGKIISFYRKILDKL